MEWTEWITDIVAPISMVLIIFTAYFFHISGKRKKISMRTQRNWLIVILFCFLIFTPVLLSLKSSVREIISSVFAIGVSIFGILVFLKSLPEIITYYSHKDNSSS